jgi:hypothetical protein
MWMSCHASAWSGFGQGEQGSGLAVAWTGVQRGSGVTEQQGRARVGPSPLQNPAWATLDTLPARCLMKCPKENDFQILERFLVGCIHIIFEVDWWWWWSNLISFARIQNAHDLHFQIWFQL